MTTKALLATLKAKPGMEKDVAEFLKGAQGAVEGEPETPAWFAVQFDESTFGIFDAFPGEAGREAHLSGEVASALMARADELFAEPPHIQKLDVLADKLPG